MATYIQIGSTVTVGAGGQATIEFTAIPATYTDLKLVLSARGTTSAAYTALKISFNGSTTSYTGRQLYGDGTGAVSNNFSAEWAGYIDAATATTSTFSSTELYVTNYAGSTNKSSSVEYAQENNTTTAILGMWARLWSNTAAITQITCTPEVGNFAQYSTASLYGILKS
jgi:hypothetical protein